MCCCCFFFVSFVFLLFFFVVVFFVCFFFFFFFFFFGRGGVNEIQNYGFVTFSSASGHSYLLIQYAISSINLSSVLRMVIHRLCEDDFRLRNN